MNDSVKREQPLPLVSLAVLFALLLAAIAGIAGQFVELNANVEYERSVFITQIAEQMKNHMDTSRKNHLQTSSDFAAMLGEVRPSSFEEVRALFPGYTSNDAVNRLFFLSDQCELYGIDGVKQWVSLPYSSFLLDMLTAEHMADFIRIGTDREFMVYSSLLPSPVQIDGMGFTALLYAWDSSEYRAALSSRLFEEKSSALLVGKDGSVAIYPEEGDSEVYGYNIFTYLQDQELRPADVDTIRRLLAGTQDTTVLCDTANGRWLFRVAYYSDSYRILIMLPIQATSSGTYRSLMGLLISVVAALLLLFVIVAVVLLSVYRRQRAQRERELRTELLMKTAQAKNEFLAKMSHDIRTPLNGIIGMNGIAVSIVPPGHEDLAACLKKVERSAKYLLGILNDILDMSKIESGRVELSVSPFTLEMIREGVEPLVLSQIADKGVRFTVDFPDRGETAYIGDELRIKQILMNLLSNAVKFTDQGSVNLAVKVIPADGGKDRVVFTVRDTGKGMTPAFLERIFSPFTQEDSGISASYGGSGLGLSIVKSYVDLMGGTIAVSSAPGRGSAFTVTLPLERTVMPEQPAEAVRTEDAPRFPGRRALLCEDNELNAEIATAVLERFGLKVDWAENGRIGVERFKAAQPGHYDVIFMDVRMPELDGYEATRSIRSLDRPDAKLVPICALSANAFSDDVSHSLAVGMNEHLAKPLDVEQLADFLTKYLSSV